MGSFLVTADDVFISLLFHDTIDAVKYHKTVNTISSHQDYLSIILEGAMISSQRPCTAVASKGMLTTPAPASLGC